MGKQQQQPAQVFDLASIEAEITEELQQKYPLPERLPSDFAPPLVRTPMLPLPDYVNHKDGVSEVGKLSAEAVAREYEAAAKEVEAMGTDCKMPPSAARR